MRGMGGSITSGITLRKVGGVAAGIVVAGLALGIISNIVLIPLAASLHRSGFFE